MEGVRERMRKNVGDLLRIAQIPEDAASLGLAVCDHPARELTGWGCGV
jgi:hypothetical protein